jgi:uncharacterized protein YbjT (DUF2867 family)
MTPPNFDPEPGFPQTREILAAARAAIFEARPGKVVFLSTVGAQVREPNLLSNALIMEDGLRDLPVPVAFLRPAWFMENAAWDVAAARTGMSPSFLQPLDHPIPMVATADVGRVAAELLRETWAGVRVVELEARRRYAANDIASGFAHALGRPVRAEAVPRDSWEALFRGQGARNPTPRMRMLDGFNQGWIDFERAGAETRYGDTSLETVLGELVGRSEASA